MIFKISGTLMVISTFPSIFQTVERCKHVKSRATTVYFKLGTQKKAGTLRRVSTYVQHVWGIIGHVTAEGGNRVGTDGAPPKNQISSRGPYKQFISL